MNCQRCLGGREAQYCAYTDAMKIEICSSCAQEALRLGIAVEPVMYCDVGAVRGGSVSNATLAPAKP